MQDNDLLRSEKLDLFDLAYTDVIVADKNTNIANIGLLRLFLLRKTVCWSPLIAIMIVMIIFIKIVIVS